jgi:hypothetical protein
MSHEVTGGKSIKLNKLKADEYRLWVMQAEATFEVHGCLDIVLGEELKPSNEASTEDEDTELFSIHLAEKDWHSRHALAREALLKALETTDLLKVFPVKDSAPAIWSRLRDEYGKSLDFEYIRINAEFQSLRKDSKTSMNAHIDKFNQLLQAVHYNKPPEIPDLKTAAIDLYF